MKYMSCTSPGQHLMEPDKYFLKLMIVVSAFASYDVININLLLLNISHMEFGAAP